MSFRAFSHIHAPLLRLPPPIRVNIYRHTLSRQFHATTPKQFTVPSIANPLYWPHEALVALHSIGLPWAAVIPISAVLVRLAITLTLTYPSHLAASRRASLRPLLTGLQRAAKQSGKFAQWSDAEVQASVARAQGSATGFWRAQPWRTATPLLQLPVFVGFVETLRAVAGAGVGFFGAIRERVLRAWAPGAALDAVDLEYHRDDWFEPSFREEGLAWFQDLTVPDPTGVLPVVAPALLLSNLVVSMGLYNDAKSVLDSLAGRAALTLGIVITVALWRAAPVMPSGLLYFWACSSACALLSKLWLDMRYPILRIAPTRREIPRARGRQRPGIKGSG